MQILTVNHDDFELVVECNSLYPAFQRARAKNREIFSATSYVANDARLLLLNPGTNELEEIDGNAAHPVFFENKDYFIGITFKNDRSVKRASIHSRLREVQDKFYFRPDIGFLAGTINYGNDLGKSDLVLRYEIGSETKEFDLKFEVFPTKLDYRNDFDSIVVDIEKEYPYLVLDFLKKTYSSFKSGQSPNTDLIWWQVFGGLYTEFIRASRFILHAPHRRIVKESKHVKAESLMCWTNILEEQFYEFKHFSNRRYLSQHKTLSPDTPENRFFKHALVQTTRRFNRVRTYIVSTFPNQISDEFCSEMAEIAKQMELLSTHPFLARISPFTGIRQESLVLYKASGYSNIYRCWVMLSSGLRFLEGIQKIELKNIADLYQIWCFLEIKSILQKLLKKEKPDDVDIAEIQVDDFVFRIKKGAKSRVTFLQPNGDRVELFHDYSYHTGHSQDVRSFTITQRPDIVLRVAKNDLRDNYIFTYLYDAKYRLQSDDNPMAPDSPPDDAINQMHRYRDAIYYSNKERNKPEKEVIGAYILFPGDGGIEQIRSADYYRSIQHVNIGAFPLRPNDQVNRELLEEHLRLILGIDTETVLNDVSPQKFQSYEVANPFILIGFVNPDSYEPCFARTSSPFYYTGEKKPRHVGRSDLKFFAPYRKGIGITEYFEILDISFAYRNAIEGIPPSGRDNGSSERMIIELGKRFELPNPVRPWAAANPYIYTTLSLLRNPKGDRIDTFPSDDITRIKLTPPREGSLSARARTY